MLFTPNDHEIIFPKRVSKNRNAIKIINHPFSDPVKSLKLSIIPLLVEILSTGIATPIPNAENSNGISIVQPIKPEKINNIGSANFFRFPNIYYSINNEIYKIGSFQKRYDGRKYKQNSNGIIVKNAVENSTSNEICGLGLNPNNGERIIDESVGYIDSNGAFCFPNENLNIFFGSIIEKEEDLLDK